MIEQKIDVKRQACEIYSRVVGYLRPIQSWNAGKQSEFQDRSSFKTEGSKKNWK